MNPPTEHSLAATIGSAIQAQEHLDRCRQHVANILTPALRELIKPGDIIPLYSRQFGRLHCTRGNARGVDRFEVATAPRLLSGWSVHHIGIARFMFDAHPMNMNGKRLSGRPGNAKGLNQGPDASTITLEACIARDAGPDDTRSDLELAESLLQLAREAAAARATGGAWDIG